MGSYEVFRGGSGGGNGRNDPPDFGKLFQQNRNLVVLVAIVAIGALGFSTSFYQVQPDEVGVVLRFGKHIGNTNPGPHFRIPFGVDQVIKIPVERQQKMEFGFRTARAGVQSQVRRSSQTAAEAEMLTGDFNVALVEWIVQYKVANPEKYLFNFRDVDTTLRLMAEAVMRTVVGDHSIDEVLTEGRVEIERKAKEAYVELSKYYDTGIVVQQLKLQDVNVADAVRPALREVEEAKQEKESAINEAKAEYNKVIPLARGRAKQAVEEAEGYAVERLNHASGDADRFAALYKEYRKATKVTRMRLYLEAVSDILPQVKNKVIVDDKVSGLLPLLNLKGGSR